MAVKASVTITISKYRDTDSITRFYKLQASTASAPAKPTTLTPSGWTNTEPTYTSGSTNTLYFTDRYIFSDGTFQYTEVSKSSSYEAAKEAYNKAQAAQDSADATQENLNNLEIDAGNLLFNGQKQKPDSSQWSDTMIISYDDLPQDSNAKFKARNNRTSKYYVPFDKNRKYKISCWFKSLNSVSTSTAPYYPSIIAYDMDKLQITYDMCKHLGSTTTLTEDLKAGDTLIHVNDLSGWNDNSTNMGLYIGFFNYESSTGYKYNDYTRNRIQLFNSNEDKTQYIDKINNTITLKTAYSGQTIPAGTVVSQLFLGSTFVYPFGGLTFKQTKEWMFKEKIFDYKYEKRLAEASYIRFSVSMLDDRVWCCLPCLIDVTNEQTIAKTVKTVDVEYYLSTSSTECTGGSWSTTAPAWVDGKYMWSRQKVTYVDNTTDTRNQTCIAGAKGENGKGVLSIIDYYGVSDSNIIEPENYSVSSNLLPNEYQQVEYIESVIANTPSYIRTDYIPTQNTKISIKYIEYDNRNSTYYQYPTIMGSGPIATIRGFVLCRYRTAQSNNSNSIGVPNSDIDLYYGRLTIVEVEKNKLILNGTEYTGDVQSINISNCPIYLFVYGFGNNGVGSINNICHSTAKLYNFKIYENNILQRNYIPCYRKSDNKPGLYDIINNTFITTNTSTDFNVGPNSLEPISDVNKYLWGYSEIEYSDGTKIETDHIVKGVHGDSGSDGMGISSITEEYYLSTSKTTQTGGSWTTTPPTWENGKYIWTRSKIIYNNPTSTVYTTPLCSSEWEAVNELEIGGRNFIVNSANGVGYAGSDTGGIIIDNGNSSITVTSAGGEKSRVNWWRFLQVPLLNKPANLLLPINYFDTNFNYITISFDIKISNVTNDNAYVKFNFDFRGTGVNINYSTETIIQKNDIKDGEWIRVHQILKTKHDDRYISCVLGGSIYYPNENAKIEWRNWKLEKGDKPTEWTPAPEDIETSINNVTNYIDQNVEILQQQIDGAIQFWNGPDIPTVNNYPANNWTTDDEKTNHIADIYTVIQDVQGELKQGKGYRFDKVNNNWVWVEITDNELSAVQALASSKAKVYVTTPTVPYAIGDLWLKDSKLYKCKTAKDSAGSYNINDWELATDYTNDAKALEVEQQLNNLQIGGRNYILDSSNLSINNLNSTPGSHKEYAYINVGKSYKNIEAGTKVTISFDLEMQVNTANPRLVVYNQNINGPKYWSNKYISLKDYDVGSTIKKRVNCTVTLLDRDNPSTSDNYIEFFSDYGTSNWFKITNLKLEIGDKATDYTLAPEDVDANINQVQENLDNIKIGGENYYLDSDTFTSAGNGSSGITPSITNNGLWKIEVASGNSNWHSWYHKNIIETNMAENEEFTFSFDIKSADANKTIPPNIYFKSGLGYYSCKGSVGSEWSRCYYTGKWKKTNSIGHHFGWEGLAGTYYIRRLKFEKGNKPTDWTPALEDIDNNINQVQENLDNLEIGGRNLIRNGTFKYNLNDWKIGNSGQYQYELVNGYNDGKALKIVKGDATTYIAFYQFLNVIIKANTMLTASMKVKTISGNADNIYMRFSNTYSMPMKSKKVLDDGWVLYTYQGAPTSDINTESISFGPNGAAGEFIFDDLKLEYGNKPTYWTAAPEDTDTEIKALNTLIEESDYNLLYAEPSDWSTDYKRYYKKSNEQIYVLTTEQPSDWSTNYTDYYTKSYSLLVAEPSDWELDYMNYYVKNGNEYNHITGGYAPTFETNKYYEEVYSSVSGDSAPTWITGTYYKLGYSEIYIHVTGSTAPTWQSNKYYEFIPSINSRLINAETTIDSIRGKIINQVIDANGKVITTQTSSGLSINLSGITSDISKILEDMADKENSTDASVAREKLQEQLSRLKDSTAFIRCYKESKKYTNNGTTEIRTIPIIELGSNTSPFHLKINNEGIYFVEGYPVFTLTSSQPSDWSTNYINYYKKDDDDENIYVQVQNTVAPTWKVDTYYSKNTSNEHIIAFANNEAFYNLKAVVQKEVQIGSTWDESQQKFTGSTWSWQIHNGNLGLVFSSIN